VVIPDIPSNRSVETSVENVPDIFGSDVLVPPWSERLVLHISKSIAARITSNFSFLAVRAYHRIDPKNKDDLA